MYILYIHAIYHIYVCDILALVYRNTGTLFTFLYFSVADAQLYDINIYCSSRSAQLTDPCSGYTIS